LDAEDIVQQAFLALLTARVPPSDVPAWLFGAVRKLVLMQARANGRRERREKGAARHEVCLPRDPARSLDLEMVMAELDADDRDMVLARVHGGLSCEEIGTMMGVSATTAWRRLDAAMAAIRLRLEGEI
jgi:RNA polymerase sigma factor (sigma-70 family)